MKYLVGLQREVEGRDTYSLTIRVTSDFEGFGTNLLSMIDGQRVMPLAIEAPDPAAAGLMWLAICGAPDLHIGRISYLDVNLAEGYACYRVCSEGLVEIEV